MKKVTIVSLIYKSSNYADFIYNQLYRHTEELKDGSADFFFIANDATEEVLTHLKNKRYKFYDHKNPKKTDQELFELGIGWPNYLYGVYKAWNEAILKSETDLICLVNSDMGFSPGWLTNMLSKITENTVIGSKLVERIGGKFPPFINDITGSRALIGNYGWNPNNYDEEGFLQFTKFNKKDGVEPGGAYMPILLHKSNAVKVGLYPEGNLHNGINFNQIKEYGDQNFIKKLKENGIEFKTALDSLVYHFKEGEMSS